MAEKLIDNRSIIRYASLSKKNLGQDFTEKRLSMHIPTPDDMDYKRGYIERYFVQKANDVNSKIFEVDNVGYSKFFKNPFYTATKLDWKIKGVDDNEIKECNFKSVKLATKDIPRIQYYLPNLLQFRKNDIKI